MNTCAQHWMRCARMFRRCATESGSLRWRSGLIAQALTTIVSVFTCPSYHNVFSVAEFGGQLLDLWIRELGPQGVKRDWMRMVKTAHRTGTPVTEALMRHLFKKVGGGWFGFVLTSLGKRGIYQLHYHSFMLQFKGVSRSGRELLHKMNQASGRTSYDNWVQQQALESSNRARYVHVTPFSVMVFSVVRFSLEFVRHGWTTSPRRGEWQLLTSPQAHTRTPIGQGWRPVSMLARRWTCASAERQQETGFRRCPRLQSC